MGEKIWHLEKRVMEQRVEEMMMAETLTKTRSELKGLKERWRTLSSLLDSEEYWIETVGVVSVCVCVAIGDSLPLTAAGVLSCVLTAQYRAAGEHTLSFTSIHSCCRSSWPHLFLLTASSVTSCIHSEQTITHDSVSAIASTPSIVSKILMAASKCVLSCCSVLSCENT